MAKGKQVPVSREHRNTIKVEVARCMTVAMEHYNRHFKSPTIDYTVTGMTAGKASPLKNKIMLNTVLLAENGQVFIDGTVGHEVAHLISVELFGRSGRGHGYNWKSVMKVLGLNDERCHELDVTNAAAYHKSKFIYYCSSCGTHMGLGPIQHKKQTIHIKHDRAGYRHRCGGPKDKGLLFVKPVGKVSHDEVEKMCDQLGKRNIHNLTPIKAERFDPTPATPKKFRKVVKNVVSKRYLAQSIYNSHNHHWTRKQMIEKFVSVAGLTPAGASTYYSNFKRGK